MTDEAFLFEFDDAARGASIDGYQFGSEQRREAQGAIGRVYDADGNIDRRAMLDRLPVGWTFTEEQKQKMLEGC